MAINRNVGSSTLSKKRICKSDGGFQERDEEVSCHATGYLADPKEARGSQEGFGHLLY